jgi:anti-sigma factor RsiW
MKCQDLLRMLSDYVDGNVDHAVCEEFEKHLKDCHPCHVVIDNVRKTIILYKNGQVIDLPADFREKLHKTLRERWKGGPGPSAPADPA